MNRRVLPKYCLLPKLVSVLLWGLSAARTTLCAAETESYPHLQESHLVSHMEAPCFLKAALIINITKGLYGCSLFGIHSNILGSSLLVLLSRALFASFLIKIYFNLDCANKRSISELLSLFPVWASNPYQTLYKTSQNLRKMPSTSYLESQV